VKAWIETGERSQVNLPANLWFLAFWGSIGISGSDWRLNGLGNRSGVPPRYLYVVEY
jgi:hypothetical protein